MVYLCDDRGLIERRQGLVYLLEFFFYLLLVVGITLIGNVIDGTKDKAGIFLIGRIMLLTYDNDGTNDKYQQKWNLPDKFFFFILYTLLSL